MDQWMISLTDPTAPEGEQLVGFVVVNGDWPEEARPLQMMVAPMAKLDAMIFGPVPGEDLVVYPELLGRLLRTQAEVEAAGGVWPYGSESLDL